MIKDGHIDSNDITFANETYENFENLNVDKNTSDSLNVELSNNSTNNIDTHLILAQIDSFGVLESDNWASSGGAA